MEKLKATTRALEVAREAGSGFIMPKTRAASTAAMARVIRIFFRRARFFSGLSPFMST